MCEKKEVLVLTEEICYTEFYERFLMENQLCLLSESFTDSWPCRKLWVVDGKPNWDYLIETFGKLLFNLFLVQADFSSVSLGQAIAPVANCGESCFNSHSKTNWTVADYIIYLQKYSLKNYPDTMPCLYLKVIKYWEIWVIPYSLFNLWTNFRIGIWSKTSQTLQKCTRPQSTSLLIGWMSSGH